MVKMLTNPDFEDGFHNHANIGELTIANGWEPWYLEGDGYHRPEYKPETLGVGSGRVLHGQQGQKQFTTFSKQDGGIYQRIEGLTPAAWYKFSAWAYVWSSDSDNPDESPSPQGKLAALVGINPWGDTRALYRTTIWGLESVDSTGHLIYNSWFKASVIAQAWSTAITCFTRGNAEFGAKHNDVYWDVCELVEVEPGAGPAEPEPPTTPGGGVNYSLIRTIVREEIDATRLGQ